MEMRRLKAVLLSLFCTRVFADVFCPGNVSEAMCIIQQVSKDTRSDGLCDLGDMDFSEIPSEILDALKKSKAIKKLILSKNRMKALPPRISELKNLVVLDLSDNEIERIPHEVETMESLEELILTNNKLKSFPWSLSRVATLKNLDLRSNPLPWILRTRVGKLFLRIMFGNVVKVGDV